MGQSPKNPLDELSPKRRALLELLMREKGSERKLGGQIPARPDRASAPLSFAQRRLWFLQQYMPLSPAYNVVVAYRMVGGLNVGALENAITQVSARHEVLRSRISAPDGEPIQTFATPSRFSLTVNDVRGLGGNSRQEAQRLAQAESRRPFDLSKEAPVRAFLWKVEDHEHLFALVIHHIVTDGWSMSLILRELAEFYDAEVGAKPLVASPLTIQYADYAAWQQTEFAGDKLESELIYWRKQLVGADKLRLITDFSRPSTPTDRGRRIELKLDSAAVAAIRRIAEEENSTLFAATFALFAELLHRYTRQDDVVVGIPSAGRTRPETEPLVGMFINTLALRTDLSGKPSFRELLRRATEVSLQAQSHQDVPFEVVVEALNPGRDPGSNPLFQVMFALQNQSSDLPSMRGLEVSPVEITTDTSKLDLTLEIYENAGRHTCVLEYNACLFEAATAQRMIEHYSRLLNGAGALPDQPLADIGLITEEEERVLIHDWNRTEVPFDLTRTVSRIVEERAAEYPDRIAVSGGGKTISYAELNSKANRLARHLQALGTAPDKLVGVCLRRSPAMVVALLAVLKSGAAYVPLDAEYPPDRLAYILGDAGAQILLTERAVADTTAEYSGVRVFVDDDWGAGNFADTNLPDAPAPSQLAYVIYTSGSTGRPKGVEIEHRGLINLVRWHCRRYSITPQDRATQISSPGFDASVWELWPYLSAGASVHICADELRLSPEQLLAWIAGQQITIAFVITALAMEMMALPMPSKLHLRALLTGGDKMHRPPRALPFEVVNHYGPTENTVVATETTVHADCVGTPTIGRPIDNVRVCILDEDRRPVPIGLPGEIYIGGASVSRGYHNRPELTAERFVADPFRPGERLYRTGDLARFRADAQIEFIGRVDNQVKLRGFRVEPGEIEAVLTEAPGIKDAAVIVTERNGSSVLAAYLVATSSAAPNITVLRSYLKTKLPHYMAPAAITFIPKLPLNPNGKVDRRALPPPVFESESTATKQAPVSETERIISEIWKELLGVKEVGRDDNFFDLGGHSLLLTKVHKRLERELGLTFSIVNLFAHPTVSALAEFLKSEQAPEPKVEAAADSAPQSVGRAAAYSPIAIIGMAGRFPGANSVDELWRLVSEGREAIRQYSDEELLEAGVDRALLDDPNYVKAGTSLDCPEWFDAKFFGMSAREADITDPQHRLLLECAHQALESSACDPQTYPGRIGVFTGAGISSYFLHNVHTNASAMESVGPFQAMLGMDKDFAATRISYKLNLRGPAFSVQTACSTSLVAVHLACQSLLEGACEVALAGGVSVFFPQKQGYMYQPAGILSPDGHCRAFDADAQGTVSSNGAAVVVLKRLSDALRDGDTIHAVIRGSAINNDGSLKVGYTAPSVEGQSQVIRAAQAAAGISGDDITYVETHGTGTVLGDPIEVEALRQAFSTERRQFCALSSLKSNVGHLDAAAGVAGLIKAALALKHRQLPPTLHFRTPNPKLELSASPFYVNDALLAWDLPEGAVRRAGVSSFGIGGTNAHVILEEAPQPETTSASTRPLQLLSLSAKSATALQAASVQLSDRLSQCAESDLADVAFSLHCGRTAYPYRKALVVRSLADGVKELQEPGREIAAQGPADRRTVAFMFPGQGSQHPGMARSLYEHEPVFRREVDTCADLFEPELGLDLRTLLFANASDEDARRQLNQTWLTQPALFTIEYALARWWMHLGLQPEGMIGHSIGEYVAACLASVFSLEDAVRVVALRGRLMQRMPAGAMLSVAASEDEVRAVLPPALDIAALNSPKSCVVSGPEKLVAEFERAAAGKFESRRLHTSHAFHSAMFDPMVKEFESALAQFTLNEPKLRFISNLSGQWIEPHQARSPQYWSAHLRSTVRFAEGVAALAKSGALLIECGPGNTLSSLARQGLGAGAITVPTLPHARQADDDLEFATRGLAKLWTLGGGINWQAYHDGERRRRLPLPTYPFERQRHWVEPGKPQESQSRLAAGKRKNIEEWFYSPSWERTAAPVAASEEAPRSWVVFDDGSRFAATFVEQLRGNGHHVARVIPGPAFRNGGETFHARISAPEDFAQVLRTLPDHAANFIHFWSGLATQAGDRVGFDSLLNLAKAEAQVRLGKADRFVVVTTRLRDVLGDETVEPPQATILGLTASLPIELPGVSAVSVDLDRAESTAVAPWLIAECSRPQPDAVVAYRGRHRWVRNWRPLELGSSPANAWIEKGCYVITGGTGGIGLQLAGMLAKERNARLALVSRTPLPPRSRWEELASGTGPNSSRINALLEVERNATELLLLPGDIGNCAEAERAFSAAVQQFGKIDVVIHAAGERVSGTIEKIERAECDRQFAAKIPGTQNVHYLAERFGIPRVIVVSSIASALGVYGHAAYAAAHSALDAFATLCRTKAAWTTVNLDNWITDDAAALPSESDLVMTPPEGREVFRRILRSGTDSIFVSTDDPSARAARTGALAAAAIEEAAEPSAIAHPRPALSSSYTAPRNEIEKKCAAVWRDVLGCDEVGVHDNFFELGGDSVMALQLVARVRPFGLTITPKQVYESPTIAELAARIPTAPGPAAAKETTGPAPLSPIQSWFFHHEFQDRNHFNHALLLKAGPMIEAEPVRAALQSVVECHDALRLRFRREADGWVQEAGGPELPLDVQDMRSVPDDRLVAEIEAAADRLQRSLNLEEGPVFRAAWFDCGGGRESRLLLVAHHLVVDLASWQIIVRELSEALRADGPRVLPARSADFRSWANRIAEQTNAGAFDGELDYWAERLQSVEAIQTDFSASERCDEASAAFVRVSYPQPSTQLLLHDSARAFAAQPQELLLAALYLCLAPRCSNQLVVDMEGTGREPIYPDLDISNTVGWFTSLHPVLVHAPSPDPADAIRAARNELKNVPRDGIGFGALRYVCSTREVQDKLRHLSSPEVMFLFHGRQELGHEAKSVLRLSNEPCGRSNSPRNPLTHKLTIGAAIKDDTLQFDWMFSTRLFRRETVDGFARGVCAALDSFNAAASALPKAAGASARISSHDLQKVLTRMQSAK